MLKSVISFITTVIPLLQTISDIQFKKQLCDEVNVADFSVAILWCFVIQNSESRQYWHFHQYKQSLIATESSVVLPRKREHVKAEVSVYLGSMKWEHCFFVHTQKEQIGFIQI